MAASEPPFKRLVNGYKIDSISGCWVWQGHKYRNGYGCIKVFGKMVSAHRFSYELHKGPIPRGMHLLHSCDRKLCINPDHLRPGTHQENMKEAKERGRMRKGKLHPMYGKRVKRPRQSNQVLVLGKRYASQKEAERDLGLGAGTVRFWLNNKPEKAKLLKKGELNE